MRIRKAWVCVLMTLLILLVCALTVSALAIIEGDFEWNDTNKRTLVRYLGDDEYVKIPKRCRTIGANAFRGNETLEKVYIPDTVTEIEAGAFENCIALAEVRMSTNVVKLPENVFNSCTALTGMLLPRGLTGIGDYAFANCVNLMELTGPDQAKKGPYNYFPVTAHVTTIGTGAFNNCPRLVIPCFKGSALETYCINNGLQYDSIDPIIYKITANRPVYVLVHKAGRAGSVTVTVTLDPTIATTSLLGFSTSDRRVATIDENGIVTTTGRGRCKITVASKDQNDVFINIPLIVLDGNKGWQKTGGAWYHVNSDGSISLGWAKIGALWYYFNPNEMSAGYGQMLTGWQYVEGAWYYFGPSGTKDGHMRTGWITDSGNVYYCLGNGQMQTGWLKLNNKWYYFNTVAGTLPLGAMYRNGVFVINGVSYLFDENGVLAESGWRKVNGVWYYKKPDGSLAKGWLKDGNKWYYMDPTTGAMQTGWQTVSGKRYHFDRNGVMQTGWQKIGKYWYYFENSGAMHTGWLKLGKDWYYLKKDGVMVTGTYVIDGKTYHFANNGKLMD